jgi:hypothetical protein
VRLCALLATLVASSALAAPPRYDVDVSVDTDRRLVDGTARIEVSNDGPTELRELFLWNYPARFATRSEALNDVNFYWIYPRAFHPTKSKIAITVAGRAVAAEVRDHPDAGPRTLLRVPLDPPLQPGARVTVETRFELEVPARYGAFGCFRKTCTLTGFHPMLAAADLSAPPLRGEYRVRVRVPRASDVIVNGDLRGVEKGGAVAVDAGLQRAASIVVGPPKFRTVEMVHRGVKVVLYTTARKPVPSPPEHLLPYLPADRTGKAMNAIAEGLDLLAELGTPMEPRTIRLVEGALRIELAQAQPGYVLVSDQMFDIFPLQRFLKFHEFEIVRAVFEAWLDEHLATGERADDIGWSPQVSASWLVDAYTLRSYRRAEFAEQILKYAAFIPAIDRILYAPQVPFASAYFYTLEDPDPLRDNLQQFANRRPRGKLVYSKLRDLLGDAAMAKLLRAQLDGEPIRAAAERLDGAKLDWFFRQWLGPYPKMDYRFRTVEHDGLRYRVVVERIGEQVREPVEVRAIDARGRRVVKRWDGVGPSGELDFELEAPLSVIEIDPRGRLVEDLPGSNDDLRFDNRKPPRWKFVYNNFGGLIQVLPTFALDLSLDFSLNRILDVKNFNDFLIYHSAATQIGVRYAYSRAFGHKVTQSSLDSAVTASVAVSRIDPTFGNPLGNGENGTYLGFGLSLSYADRLFVWEPTRGTSATMGASLSLTILDSGRVLTNGTVSAGISHIVPLTDGHQLAFSISAALAAGDIKLPRQLVFLPMSGYAPDGFPSGAPGRAYGVFGIEYRHVYVHSLNINLLHSLYIRGIGGSLFAEGGFVTACESYNMTHESGAASVGYALRFFGDWFGVSQTTFNLGFGVPIYLPTRTCLTQHDSKTGMDVPIPVKQSVPFGFFFYFGPP